MISPTVLGIELRRLVRNRRTLVFTVVMPPVFFEIFGVGNTAAHERAGNGNVIAYVLVSMAVYGAMLASTSAGASVSLERAAGWSRQLRLTPLNPLAYMVTKVLTAMVMGAVSVAIVFAVGALSGAVQMPGWAWVVSALVAWIGAIVFAAFGLFIGYLVPSENVMQLLGPALALLALMGGIFVPLDVLSSTLQTLASYTPAYGVGVLARASLVGNGVDAGAVANVVVWTAIFGAGAVWRFRRDTARV